MKEIQLTRGMVAFVDDEDFKNLNKWKWFAHNRRGKYYAARNSKYFKGIKRTCISMHREIMGVSQDEFIDHKDGNGLNNTKSNLRKCTYSQNNSNTTKRLNSTSKYLGVSWRSDNKKWNVSIAHNKINYKIGCFTDETEAALAYNKKAIELHGEFAKLNRI